MTCVANWDDVVPVVDGDRVATFFHGLGGQRLTIDLVVLGGTGSLVVRSVCE